MRRDTLFWGTLLILLGGLLLLDNLGLIPFDVWRVFWPVALIALGLWTIWGAVFGGSAEAERVTIPLQGATRARVRVRYGAGRLELGAGAGPDELVSGTFGGGVDHRSRQDGNTLDVDMRPAQDVFPVFILPWTWGRMAHDWSAGLNPQIPLALNVESGASELRLDLTELCVSDLELKTGASSTDLSLPAHAGLTRVKIETGASSVTLRVPDGVGARIRFRGGLSSIDVDGQRFQRLGEGYQSLDYDTAGNKAEVDIESGAASVSVR